MRKKSKTKQRLKLFNGNDIEFRLPIQTMRNDFELKKRDKELDWKKSNDKDWNKFKRLQDRGD